MWHKFKFHFNSNVLSAFFILTAIGFSILLFTIWSVSVKAERIANLKRDENFIMNGITVSLLGSVELDSQGLASQSQAFMQDYLNYMFENKEFNSQFTNIARVGVYFLNPENHVQVKQMIGEWVSEMPVSKQCIERRTEYFLPPKAKYTYLIDLSLNKCLETSLSSLEYHSLSTPIAVAFAVIFIWGICIYLMLNSVKYAGRLLGSSKDTAELIDKTESIKWTNVGILAQRALQVRGKNLQYYQTLVLDSQHDIAKILDFIYRNYDDKQLLHNITNVQSIIQKLAIEVRSSDGPNNDVTGNREISGEELYKLIQIYYSGTSIENELPFNLFLHVDDISLFERLLVNLASNAAKHGIFLSHIKLKFEKNFIQLRIYTPVSDLMSLKLHFAKATGRIDVINPENPVYSKFFGRTGRGLSIVKRGVKKLGGRFIFSIHKKIVETGLDLPAYLLDTSANQKKEVQCRRKVIYFKNAEFIQLALLLGLKEFIVTEFELQQMLSESIYLDIVSDFEINVPPTSTVRILSKKERLEGIALNWLEKTK